LYGQIISVLAGDTTIGIRNIDLLSGMAPFKGIKLLAWRDVPVGVDSCARDIRCLAKPPAEFAGRLICCMPPAYRRISTVYQEDRSIRIWNLVET